MEAPFLIAGLSIFGAFFEVGAALKEIDGEDEQMIDEELECDNVEFWLLMVTVDGDLSYY